MTVISFSLSSSKFVINAQLTKMIDYKVQTIELQAGQQIILSCMVFPHF